MKNIKRHYLISILLLSAILSLISCKNQIKGDEAFLEIHLSSGLEKEASYGRSIYPAFNANYDQIKWLIYLFDEKGNLRNSFDFTATSSNSFLIPIEEGKWKIEIKGIDSSGENALIIDKSKAILAGKSDIFEINDRGFFQVSVPLFLINNQGCGQLQLKIDRGDTTLSRLILKDDSGKINERIDVNEEGIIQINLQEVAAGNYKCVFSFYSENIFLFSFKQIINIRENYITNEWNSFLNTEEAYYNPLITREDTLFLTNEVINEIRGKTFYVQGKDYFQLKEISEIEKAFIEKKVDYESEEKGSFFNPFETLAEAIELIKALNDGISNYKIILKGNIKNENPDLYTAQNNYALMNIASEKALTLEISSFYESSTIDGNNSEENPGRIAYLEGNIFLTLKNIIIKGGYCNENGGGIYVNCIKNEDSEKKNLWLLGKSKITNNFSKDSGGGIFLQEGSICIEGEEVFISENRAINKGGGICIVGYSDKENRILKLINCSLVHNIALKENGKNGVGGGLYVQFGRVDISACTISENEATNGGGIDIAQNANVTIDNTQICRNTALYTKGKGGGAIFAQGASANLYLKRGTNIFENNSLSVNEKAGAINKTSANVYIYDGVFVNNNYYNSTEISNLCFNSGKVIKISERLYNTKIGITVRNYEEACVFTDNYSEDNEEVASQFFYSDKDNFYITNNEKNEALFIKKEE